VTREIAAAPIALAAALLALAASASSRSDGHALRFERGDELVATIEVAQLARRCGPEIVTLARDPYYEKRKVFLACPLHSVLELGFGDDAPARNGAGFLFRALDGYAKPADAARIAESGAWLAIADLTSEGLDSASVDEVVGKLVGGPSGPDTGPASEPERVSEPVWKPEWEPIGRAGADPAPLYLVWTGPNQDDIHRYPWPYQLAAIEIMSFEDRYPHLAPRTAAEGSPARTGYEVFRRECVSCHAINGEGGRIGPDLNVPRSIVEYRSAEQIKAYIRDPVSFRYTTMPAHHHLSVVELDGLVAYFTVMKDLKHDPGPGASDGD
jgi:mono/diheme cytochrome c family protein